ncbi:hypothetical protein AAY473_016755 [Plecturocebus cupreus]
MCTGDKQGTVLENRWMLQTHPFRRNIQKKMGTMQFKPRVEEYIKFGEMEKTFEAVILLPQPLSSWDYRIKITKGRDT